MVFLYPISESEDLKMKDYIGVKVVAAEANTMNTEDGRYQVMRTQQMKVII